MAVSYNKLWKLLIDKGMTKTELRLKTDMSTSTLAKMSKDEVVSMDIMLRICEVLDCNVGDIMDATKRENQFYKLDGNCHIWYGIIAKTQENSKGKNENGTK